MKVVVIGSQGMAGWMITDYLRKQGCHVREINRNHINIEDVKVTSQYFKNTVFQTYDYIINCAGILINHANAHPDKAILVNSWFPKFLEKYTEDKPTKVIHLSTDCVFDGLEGPYTELDLHTERNYYGITKSLGELNNCKDLTIRTSIIGPEKKNTGSGLLNWVLTSQEKELQGWANHHWNGITTLQLAKCIFAYMQTPKISGIYHVVNNDVKINKYDLLCKINKIYNLQKNIKFVTHKTCVNKVLIDTRCEFNFNIPDYDVQLTDLKEYS